MQIKYAAHAPISANLKQIAQAMCRAGPQKIIQWKAIASGKTKSRQGRVFFFEQQVHVHD
jgi:hypothetical protein